MSYTITRLTSPSFDALSAEEIAEWVRIDSDTDALTIAMLFASAVAYVENYTGQTIAGGSVKIEYHERCTSYRLPVYPVQSITSVTYLDGDGIAQPLSYTRRGDTIHLTGFPAGPAIVTLSAGYADEDAVPAPVKHAIAVLVSSGYDDRSGLSDATQTGVGRLLLGQRRGAWIA